MRITIAAWIEWFGPARLITSAAAVLVVCGGVVWLVRTSPPPTEAGLPMATSTPPSSVAEPAVASAADQDGSVSVHVAGAVGRPGVYELDSGARVEAAIAAAGGAVGDADPNALNLAAELIDGTRVYVPVIGEPLPDDAGGAGVDGSAPLAAGPVDLNRATIAELDALPGIGPATASVIVTDREMNGPFLTVDELTRVRGIGPAKLEALAGLVTT
ncbi:MAG: helix-hairpin-helix domain-containing protein [Acidimicrobiia bacterium]|nr:helix-hairpin-helix domain-containing protein [Acidimicrobiia bacterium]